MTRKRRGALAGVCLMVLVSGCGSGNGSRSPSGGVQPAFRDIDAASPDRQEATALRLARQEGSVVFYTSLTSEDAEAVRKAFTKRYGIRMVVYRATGETLLQRIEQESQAGHPANDVVETNFTQLATGHSLRVFQPYRGKYLGKVKPAGVFADWTATRFNVLQPAWNTNLIKPGQEPRSWEDLADARFRGKLTMEVTDSDWYANVTEYWLHHGKTQAQVDSLWRQIAGNAKVASGHTAMMQMLAAGQSAVDAMNYVQVTNTAIAKRAPVAYRPASGVSSVPAFVRPNGAGIMKDAPHPAAGWLLVNWLLSPAGQQLLYKRGYTPSTSVPGDTTTQGLTLVGYDVDEIARNDKLWTKRYNDLLTGIEHVSQ